MASCACPRRVKWVKSPFFSFRFFTLEVYLGPLPTLSLPKIMLHFCIIYEKRGKSPLFLIKIVNRCHGKTIKYLSLLESSKMVVKSKLLAQFAAISAPPVAKNPIDRQCSRGRQTKSVLGSQDASFCRDLPRFQNTPAFRITVHNVRVTSSSLLHQGKMRQIAAIIK